MRKIFILLISEDYKKLKSNLYQFYIVFRNRITENRYIILVTLSGRFGFLI